MSRTLILSHVSAVDLVVSSLAEEMSSDDEYDLIVYGRSGADYPIPDGVVSLPLPPSTGGTFARVKESAAFYTRLRKRGYSSVVISQPAITQRHARGLLRGFARLTGASQMRTLESLDGNSEWQVISRGSALRDGALWVAMRILARIAADGLAVLVRLVGAALKSRSDQPCLMIEPPGHAVYFRADIELIGVELDAGGSATHTVGVITALTKAGWTVEMWTTGHISGVPARINPKWLGYWAPANVPKELAELLSGLLQTRIPRPTDVAFVYQRYSLNNLAGAVLARRWSVPLILEANNSEVIWREAAGNLSYGRLARESERVILRAADRIVAVSANAASELLQAGASSSRIRVVPNGVDVDLFEGAKPERLNFPENSFVIGFVGLFYPWHGVRFLAQAFVELHRRFPDTRLLLIGDGEERPHVEDVLRRGGAIDSTLLAGTVRHAQIPGYLAAMDVAVSPHAATDQFVGSPVKIFEYMAAGKAIVASRVGQIPEILRHEETALLVLPDDPHELAQAIQRLYQEPVLRQRLGAKARSEARRSHTWNARLQAILA